MTELDELLRTLWDDTLGIASQSALYKLSIYLTPSGECINCMCIKTQWLHHLIKVTDVNAGEWCNVIDNTYKEDSRLSFTQNNLFFIVIEYKLV